MQNRDVDLVLQVLQRIVSPLLEWISYKLLRLYIDVSERKPTYTTFDKCLYLFYEHLKDIAKLKGIQIEEVLKLKFETIYAGPYLKEPPLDCIIALLEHKGYVITKLDARPYVSENESLLQYYRKFDEISDNVHEFPKYRKYIIEPVLDKEPAIPSNIDEVTLSLINEALNKVRKDLETIKQKYGRIEEKFVNEYVCEFTKSRQKD